MFARVIIPTKQVYSTPFTPVFTHYEKDGFLDLVEKSDNKTLFGIALSLYPHFPIKFIDIDENFISISFDHVSQAMLYLAEHHASYTLETEIPFSGINAGFQLFELPA